MESALENGEAKVANPQDSQTASEFIDQQLALEADAREALPYVRHIDPSFLIATGTCLLTRSLEIRQMHQCPRSTSPDHFRLPDVLASTRLARPSLHTRGCLLRLLNLVPRRTYPRRTILPT